MERKGGSGTAIFIGAAIVFYTFGSNNWILGSDRLFLTTVCKSGGGWGGVCSGLSTPGTLIRVRTDKTAQRVIVLDQLPGAQPEALQGCVVWDEDDWSCTVSNGYPMLNGQSETIAVTKGRYWETRISSGVTYGRASLGGLRLALYRLNILPARYAVGLTPPQSPTPAMR